MAITSSVCGRITRALHAIISTGLVSALVLSCATPAPSGSTDPGDPSYPATATVWTPTAPVAETATPTTPGTVTKEMEEWWEAAAQVSVPQEGCFEVTYPSVEWRTIPCTTPPNRPYPPGDGPRPATVGNGTDYSAAVTDQITSATGSFDSVTGVTSVTGTTYGAGCTNPVTGVANIFSLQLNTAPFTTPACNGSPNPNCQGWQQFVYSNSFGTFVQYWLLNYNTACPAGWFTFPVGGGTTHCWRNGPGAAPRGPQRTSADLPNMRLVGITGAVLDTIVMWAGGTSLRRVNQDSILNLNTNWQGVEYCIVGDGCGSQAVFNAGSKLLVRTTVQHASSDAPSCVLIGYTGETNNLTLSAAPSIASATQPAIVSSQKNPGEGVASCVTAGGIAAPGGPPPDPELRLRCIRSCRKEAATCFHESADKAQCTVDLENCIEACTERFP